MLGYDWDHVGTMSELRAYININSIRPGWNESETDTMYIFSVPMVGSPIQNYYKMLVWNSTGVRMEILTKVAEMMGDDVTNLSERTEICVKAR